MVMERKSEETLTEESRVDAPRMTRAERISARRQTLLEAAIECFSTLGWATTTRKFVANEAGVSWTTMRRHFPSEADLIMFVVEAVLEKEAGLYGELLREIDNSDDLLLAYSSAAWKIASRREGIALLEILQGARSDPALAEMLKSLFKSMGSTAGAIALRKVLYTDLPAPLLQLILAIARGRAASLKSLPDGNDEEAQMLESLLRAGISAGMHSAESSQRH